MTKKALRRTEMTEDSNDDATDGSSGPSATMAVVRAGVSRLAAHRWKVLGTVGVALVGLAIATGNVDLSEIGSGLAQYATSRTDQPAAAEAAPSAVDVVTAPVNGSASPKAAVRTAEPAPVSRKGSIDPCFTPAEDCTARVVAAINNAQAEILVQAYSLTAAAIVDALSRARLRGVSVRVILDKADERDRNSGGSRLIAKRILPYVDAGVAIAHSKIIVIDRATVITSSFNFNPPAQKANAEDLLVIEGQPEVAAAYAKNWERRLAASRPYYGTMAPVL